VRSDALLYAIVDLAYISVEDAPDVLEKLITGGSDVVQLRGKNRTIDELSSLAQKVLPRTASAKIPLIANDHPEIARRVNVQGVHVGQEDESVESVRRTVQRPILVGKSTHSVAQAVAAEREGADYIGFGPIFSTPTKPEYAPVGLSHIREVHERVSIPIFCIGGIKLENLGQVLTAGAKRVVIVSGLLQANDVGDYARYAKRLLLANRESANRNQQ